ncbi:MAG: TraR/DksA C4-type zinc finger protein [Dehalococcoidia bacterium]|nr:TraR/DksA C4-type zinc finger protein [Chloroflexota bacterium]MCK4222434.1 TraR/DksA C4-type zinc finger protein [Dehalococcoidia bacterium]MCK4262663.1 TraR/DksA C4-type zinc finger protein [Dehalococcoidia bacterium]
MINDDELYRRLVEEKAQVAERLEQFKARGQEAGESREGSPFGKREEEASEAFELEKRLALEEKLAATLAKIDHALAKYEAGTYGLCDSCGRPIERERLEALPQASLCLACKARQIKDATGAR